jgi:hypothetical protein
MGKYFRTREYEEGKREDSKEKENEYQATLDWWFLWCFTFGRFRCPLTDAFSLCVLVLLGKYIPYKLTA